MDSSTENKTVYVLLKHFRVILEKWKEDHKDAIHPATELLDECGLSMMRLVDGGRNILLNVTDHKKYLLAKFKYNF